MDKDVIKMNKIIQRRFIKERLEKIIEEKKDGDLIYRSEVSDLNMNNIPSNINELQKSTSSKVHDTIEMNKALESNEKNKEDINPKEDKKNRYMNL